MIITRAMLGAGSRHNAKEALIARLLAGRELTALQTAADTYADAVLARGLRPWARQRVAWHQAQGHELLIVTASPELYVVPIARRLGIDNVLGTRLEVGTDGRITGRLDGANCRGPEKALRLKGWLAGRDVELHAYGDSRGDRELLAMADVARLVRRREP
jgi:HAD superfamily hydrolase (TIGR01490 family)